MLQSLAFHGSISVELGSYGIMVIVQSSIAVGLGGTELIHCNCMGLGKTNDPR